MHVDLCIELSADNRMTPEVLAHKVHDFERELGRVEAFTVEVTPVPEGATFTAALVERQANAG